MEWYYAIEDERKGPVSEDEFKNLVDSNTISGDTLVWNSNMEDWDSYSNINSSKPPEIPQEQNVPETRTLPTDENRNNCVECGGAFPKSEMISYENSWVCRDCKNIFIQKVKEGVQTDEVEYAGFWIRVGAKLIDGILLMIVGGIVGVIMGLFIDTTYDPYSGHIAPGYYLSQFIQFVFGIFYYVYFVGTHAATPGKMACGLKIISPETGKVSHLRAFGRYWSELISALILCIGYIMVAWDSEKKGLHDIMCNTRVIKK
ncbi:MAG: RDD family protein [Desulfobacterales bacterium]|nr:RDD family protein [Desulfobacterales bacterium]MCP4160774.1 RDD family protein [Deltaproteobacteria bacterium]